MRRTWFVAFFSAGIAVLSALTIRHAERSRSAGSGSDLPLALDTGDGAFPGPVKKGDQPSSVSSERDLSSGVEGASGRSADQSVDSLDPADTDAGDRAVVVWEKTLDRLLEQEAAPAGEQLFELKTALDRVQGKARMECVRQALNLLPDDRFVLLAAILLDKKEETEVLETIFGDMLNRAEEVKYPLLDAIQTDRAHPLAWEAVRILDIVTPDADTGTDEDPVP